MEFIKPVKIQNNTNLIFYSIFSSCKTIYAQEFIKSHNNYCLFENPDIKLQDYIIDKILNKDINLKKDYYLIITNNLEQIKNILKINAQIVNIELDENKIIEKYGIDNYETYKHPLCIELNKDNNKINNVFNYTKLVRELLIEHNKHDKDNKEGIINKLEFFYTNNHDTLFIINIILEYLKTNINIILMNKLNLLMTQLISNSSLNGKLLLFNIFIN